MQLLITGGAGFIGSHSVAAALAAGQRVRVFDNLSTGSRENVPPDAELVVGDVTDYAQVQAAAAGCDAVLHLAALVSVPQSMREPLATLAINSVGTANVLEAARAAGARRFVLASTCAVYGDLPGRQEESSPVLPLSPYAGSKLLAEQWTRLYTTAYGLPVVILRYFNVYGPGQRADSPYSGVLARWCAAVQAGEVCTVFGDGEQTRDFVSVHDVAAANLLALTSDSLEPGAVYNVATGQSASLNAILGALDAAAGRSIARRYAPARPGDIIHSAGSSARLQACGWQPQFPLAQGIAELLSEPDSRSR
jgi:UDP-glucose 4-epimerase